MIRAAAIAFIFWSTVAQAHESADAAFASWFAGLTRPDTHTSCCSMGDCKHLPWRSVPAGYEVLVGGAWVPVPPEKILQHIDNPTGDAVTCWTPTNGVMCFIRVAES